jgi:hypothetical protein
VHTGASQQTTVGDIDPKVERESARLAPDEGARFSDQVEDIDESEPPLIVEPSPSGSAALCPTTGEAYLADLALLWLAGDVEGGFIARCLF